MYNHEKGVYLCNGWLYGRDVCTYGRKGCLPKGVPIKRTSHCFSLQQQLEHAIIHCEQNIELMVAYLFTYMHILIRHI